MNSKLLIFGFMGLLLVGCVSGYICIDTSNDNNEVIEFKNKINLLALEQDIDENGLTEEALRVKLKYFGPCR